MMVCDVGSLRTLSVAVLLLPRLYCNIRRSFCKIIDKRGRFEPSALPALLVLLSFWGSVDARPHGRPCNWHTPGS